MSRLSPKIRISNFVIKIISSFFFIGYLPFIPGTFGSLAGLFLYFVFKDNYLFYILLLFVLMVTGFSLTGKAEEILGRKDAPCIVIDEVIGMLLALIFIPYEIKLLIIDFVLFRILDALKPYPSGMLQNLKGSLGIMSDDIIAGLYTNIILQVVLRFASFKIS
ncbi:MAG: phosphatidylglycerophosphatase A [Candidatus Omnitrophica bacterium]|nr:phosphatidylglycerophosphatase A [Candidatus Omnitrophota bacterium]